MENDIKSLNNLITVIAKLSENDADERQLWYLARKFYNDDLIANAILKVIFFRQCSRYPFDFLERVIKEKKVIPLAFSQGKGLLLLADSTICKCENIRRFNEIGEQRRKCRKCGGEITKKKYNKY